MARAQAQQYKKSSVHRTGQVSHSSNSISSCYDLSCASQNTKSHATPQSCDGLKIWTFLPKLEANHCRDLEHKQRLIDLDHAESAAALGVCLYTELWKQEGGTAHQKHQNTNIIFSYTVMFSRTSYFLPGALKLYSLRIKLSSGYKNNCLFES